MRALMPRLAAFALQEKAKTRRHPTFVQPCGTCERLQRNHKANEGLAPLRLGSQVRPVHPGQSVLAGHCRRLPRGFLVCARLTPHVVGETRSKQRRVGERGPRTPPRVPQACTPGRRGRRRPAPGACCLRLQPREHGCASLSFPLSLRFERKKYLAVLVAGCLPPPKWLRHTSGSLLLMPRSRRQEHITNTAIFAGP